MKGAHPDSLGAVAHQTVHPLPHLSRRLVGEGDGHNVPGGHSFLLDEIGHPVGQHPGLSGTGSGQHQKRSFCAEDRLFLHGI